MHRFAKQLTLAAGALALAAAFGASGGARAGSIPESNDPIKLAMNEWTGQHITTYVAGEVLKKMGYNVEYVTAGYYPQMTALQDGTIDATLEIWSSNIGKLYDEALASGKVEEIGDLGLVPREAWMYPAYVEDMCPGLPDWKALKNCADVFATPDTFPNGRFVDYPADWGTTNVDRIKALGLPFTSIPAGSEGAEVAEIKAAFASKQPLLMQFWSPHWVHAVYDMRIVQLPPYEDGCYTDPSWGLNSNATYDCDWLIGYIKKMAWVGLKDKWPGAYRFLKAYHLTNDDQNAMMKEIDVDGRDPVEVIHEWMDANEYTWESWVGTAAATN